ncbi:hypothetical protein AMAG_02076 [Allomyces macrogynus ATCC 38327]|uniref:Uncharacterized protein n=1 Tax=Allomyces macrogynus (strain ATCC 38327) TaxID=578462 RepID=A0A0L0S117_ALLM3|nr:hypothetical protein AMAG_02076 [Allomyces macrogynus ATCC 38327]|eukprot:KNE56243.1 hypothetical protein AMAG_02076 [Allomyces macrogynus ATCC 38327]
MTAVSLALAPGQLLDLVPAISQALDALTLWPTAPSRRSEPQQVFFCSNACDPDPGPPLVVAVMGDPARSPLASMVHKPHLLIGTTARGPSSTSTQAETGQEDVFMSDAEAGEPGPGLRAAASTSNGAKSRRTTSIRLVPLSDRHANYVINAFVLAMCSVPSPPTRHGIFVAREPDDRSRNDEANHDDAMDLDLPRPSWTDRCSYTSTARVDYEGVVLPSQWTGAMDTGNVSVHSCRVLLQATSAMEALGTALMQPEHVAGPGEFRRWVRRGDINETTVFARYRLATADFLLGGRRTNSEAMTAHLEVHSCWNLDSKDQVRAFLVRNQGDAARRAAVVAPSDVQPHAVVHLALNGHGARAITSTRRIRREIARIEQWCEIKNGSLTWEDLGRNLAERKEQPGASDPDEGSPAAKRRRRHWKPLSDWLPDLLAATQDSSAAAAQRDAVDLDSDTDDEAAYSSSGRLLPTLDRSNPTMIADLCRDCLRLAATQSHRTDYADIRQRITERFDMLTEDPLEWLVEVGIYKIARDLAFHLARYAGGPPRALLVPGSSSLGGGGGGGDTAALVDFAEETENQVRTLQCLLRMLDVCEFIDEHAAHVPARVFREVFKAVADPAFDANNDDRIVQVAVPLAQNSVETAVFLDKLLPPHQWIVHLAAMSSTAIERVWVAVLDRREDIETLGDDEGDASQPPGLLVPRYEIAVGCGEMSMEDL